MGQGGQQQADQFGLPIRPRLGEDVLNLPARRFLGDVQKVGDLLEAVAIGENRCESRLGVREGIELTKRLCDSAHLVFRVTNR